MLLSKLTEIEQQIKLEKRTRKKTQRFYKNLRESNKGNEKTAKGEPRHEKTGLRGFRPGPTQTGLYKLRKELEA